MADTSSVVVGFIGFGRMASAIWEGIRVQNAVAASQVIFTTSSASKARQIETRYNITAVNLNELLDTADIVLCCVKPHQVRSVLQQFPSDISHSFILGSICAGIPISVFEKYLGDQTPIVRIMPNMPIAVGYGMSAMVANAVVTETIYATVCQLFSSFGKVMRMEQESDLDIVTGISGSGPAFFYRLADQMSHSAMSEGLSYQQSLLLTAQTMVGAGMMLLSSDQHPTSLTADVASPNGTTAAGLAVFDKSSLDHDIQDVVTHTIRRARELSQL